MSRPPICRESIFLYLEKLGSELSFPTYWLDQDGVIIGANQAALDFFEFDTDHFLIGQTMNELYPGIIAEHIVHSNYLVMQTGQISSQKLTMIDRENREWQFRAMKIPIKNELGHIVGLVILPETEASPD